MLNNTDYLRGRMDAMNEASTLLSKCRPKQEDIKYLLSYLEKAVQECDSKIDAKLLEMEVEFDGR